MDDRNSFTRRDLLGATVVAFATSAVAGSTNDIPSNDGLSKSKPLPAAVVAIATDWVQFADSQTMQVVCNVSWKFGDLASSSSGAALVPVGLSAEAANRVYVDQILDTLYQGTPAFTPPRAQVVVRLFGGLTQVN